MNEKEQIMNDFTNLNSVGGNESSFEDDTTKKQKKGFNIWSLLLIVCILAIIGGLIYFFVVMLNPKALMANGIDKMITSFKPIVEPLNVNYDVGDRFSVNHNTKITLDGEGIAEYKSILNNSELKLNYMYDKTSKKMYLDVDTSLPSVKFNLDYYINNQEQYVLLQDIHDKYIKLDNVKTDIFATTLKKDDITYIYNKLVSSMNKNLDDKKLTKEIAMDGDPTVTAILTMSKEEYIKFMTNVKNELLSDSRITQILSIVVDEEEIAKLKNETVTADFNNFTLKVKQSILKNNLKSIELVTTSEDGNIKVLYEKKDSRIVITSSNDNVVSSRTQLDINGKNFDMSITEDDTTTTIKGFEKDGYYTYTVTYPPLTSGIMADAKAKVTDIEGSNDLEPQPAEVPTIDITYRFKNTVSSNLTYDATLGIKADGINIILTNIGSVNKLDKDISVDTSNYTSYEEVDQEALNNKLAGKFMPLMMQFMLASGIDTSQAGGLNG